MLDDFPDQQQRRERSKHFTEVVAGSRPRQDTQNLGNGKTPGHRGFLSDLTMPVRRYGLVPGPPSMCPRRGTSKIGTQVTWQFALVDWWSKRISPWRKKGKWSLVDLDWSGDAVRRVGHGREMHTDELRLPQDFINELAAAIHKPPSAQLGLL
ncbi:hypothetical protein [Nocardia sp. NPDC060259]|uniref:hypothetical protein n=1 Tax=Nocardia sp. NPDC060259 TaxID=3347088 RepID=UPI00365B9340